MEANKRRCRQQALALFYTSEDLLNTKLCRTRTATNTKENIPQQTKKLSEQVKFATPQKPVKNRKNLVWPTAVFSDSKLKSVKNCFEASEPWYRYENDVMENMQENENDVVMNCPVSAEKQLFTGPVKSKKRGVINKRRLFTSDPNDWFKHEHHEQDLNGCIFKNEDTLDSDVSCDETLRINGMNEHTAASMEAEILANKQRMESDNWFDYEANLKWPFHFPVTNTGSPDVVLNRQKNQGTEMKFLLTSPDLI
ncbi:hypothetical protein HELRODRAFT_169558 [Helobdella robusta]|uniref:Uncharacterized protein n=1 Tax=Helobdella robusta TaxID=6412 RepID=T1F234_HELRO|nr:hypothetical protein HELRODRAFT_169558 [Helobdella robusta]ESO08667.1 hypothetical protein HELRODRAFT_169558 [Helobdella robusta]